MTDECQINSTGSRALSQLMSARHSCRAFLSDPVSVELQRWILECAQRSASWCNAQPWQVHITQGQATDRFRDLMLCAADTTESDPDFAFPTAYEGVYRQRRFDCAMQLYDSVKVDRGDRVASARQARENFRLFGAPHVALITSDARLGVYGALDCGAFVANFLLAAASVGVATIPQAALATRPRLVREFFGLDGDRWVVCGISFGYEDRDHPANQFRTQRANVKDVASFVWQ
ncbi:MULTISPECIES: nitroreductase [Delftia]|uniref:Nitroreductase n=1 Tax=Delftia lacustris TaxID=558537 RepID=A0A1H3N7D8_9BURK|nr:MULTISPECIES: nitroreductase [Delftia]MDH0776324.1 nitroreductase [Delftia tsuruhatensis]MDH1459916.1 nitroreductase [Delftia tsuruhatensis]MDH1823084.1 nitroreductase [Delftia tsuruhatensis]QPS78261.1 nitroreductase [Delftia acidovorans]QPS84821.1 nitroreductase [Delftia lacustris]